MVTTAPPQVEEKLSFLLGGAGPVNCKNLRDDDVFFKIIAESAF